VAAAVERDDAAVAREVVDLRLPAARVDDRPGREQQHRRLPGAVDLVEDAHAVALDEALGVGVARASLLARATPPIDRLGQGLASKTRLNGVSAARRKREKPLPTTTSRIRASPAWAPSASPTSCDSDAGVHKSVEKP